MPILELADYYGRSQFESLKSKATAGDAVHTLAGLVFEQYAFDSVDRIPLEQRLSTSVARPLDEERVARLSETLQPLNDRERTVVMGRLGLKEHNPQTLTELSIELRVSRSTIYDTTMRAIRKMSTARGT